MIHRAKLLSSERYNRALEGAWLALVLVAVAIQLKLISDGDEPVARAYLVFLLGACARACWSRMLQRR